jgi:hypothetical protein
MARHFSTEEAVTVRDWLEMKPTIENNVVLESKFISLCKDYGLPAVWDLLVPSHEKVGVEAVCCRCFLIKEKILMEEQAYKLVRSLIVNDYLCENCRSLGEN